MSVNPCKHGDREKDQNNNFVNASAHGGAGHDREGRARRAATRASAFAGDEHPQTRSVGSRSASSYGYGNGQQGAHGGQPAARAGGEGTGPLGGGGAGSGPGGPQVTAKVMWGNVSAIKELRDKEQSERQLGTRAAGRRQ